MWATGLTVGMTAVELARPRLDAMGVIPAGRLVGAETDGKVLVGGVVTHRQRPESAKGTVFLNLEDETGMVNVICSPGAWERWRSVARGVPALVVRGRLERVDGVVSVVAEKILPLDLGPAPVVQGSRRLPVAPAPVVPGNAPPVARVGKALRNPQDAHARRRYPEEKFPPRVVPELGGSP